MLVAARAVGIKFTNNTATTNNELTIAKRERLLWIDILIYCNCNTPVADTFSPV